jgi:large subunit ribosomal protein L25
MAKRPLVEAEVREGKGKRAVARLRRGGAVPGVVYGLDAPVQMITVSEERLREIIESRSRMVELKLGAKAEPVLVKEIQYDHLGSDIYHVDFERIDLGEVVRVPVPLETRGTSKGAKSGGILDLVLKHFTVECKAGEIPNEIVVDISDLDIGQSITAGQVQVPAGVKVLDDPATIVAIVQAPREEEVAATAAEPGAAEIAEPEVITARKEKEEEEEEEEEK